MDFTIALLQIVVMSTDDTEKSVESRYSFSFWNI